MNQEERIFVSYVSGETQYEAEISHFLEDLRAHKVEVIIDAGSAEASTMDNLGRCNRFILLQTPGVITSPHVRMITYAALTLIHKGVLSGFRYIIAPISSDDLPQEWVQDLVPIDATRSDRDAREQLVQMLFGKGRDEGLAASSLPPHHSSSSGDNPPLPSYHPGSSFFSDHSSIFSETGPGRSPSTDHVPTLLRRRKISRERWLFMGIAVLLLLLLIFLSLSKSFSTLQSQGPSLMGYVHFTSSNLLDPSNITGLSDGIQGDLAHLSSGAQGMSYYAWLLPDVTNGEGPVVPIGKLAVSETGTAHINFIDPEHRNLLATESRFLITEEATNVTPMLPTPDRMAWRGVAEIAQIPNPKDMMGNMSLLTHLRHLLVAEPHLEEQHLHGGLVTWLMQYVRKTLEWSNAARGMGTVADPDLMHRHFIRILDALDGTQYVEKTGDVSPATPLIINAPIGLLTFDPAQDPPGYVVHVDLHLQNLVNSPGATVGQQALAVKVDKALVDINAHLQKARQDARGLVQMSSPQLLSPDTIPLLDDLVMQTEDAYVGDQNVMTATRTGGVIWAEDQIEHLASFSVMTVSET